MLNYLRRFAHVTLLSRYIITNFDLNGLLFCGAELEFLDDPAAVLGGGDAAGISFAPKTN
jgi:hypothetical protein